MEMRRGAIVAGLCVALVAVTSAIALASNFGSTQIEGNNQSRVSLANNATHLVRFASVEAPQKNATLGRMAAAFTAQTDLTMLETTSSANDDVVVFDFAYGLNGAIAWVMCPSSAVEVGTDPNRWCFGQELRYNLTYEGPYDTSGERAWVACHELAHTVGVQHTSAVDSCLRNTYNGTAFLSSHDTAHINSHY